MGGSETTTCNRADTMVSVESITAQGLPVLRLIVEVACHGGLAFIDVDKCQATSYAQHYGKQAEEIHGSSTHQ